MMQEVPCPYTLESLKDMPTICTTQDADLKHEDGCHRYWVTRTGPEDGEEYQVHVEMRVSGVWEVFGAYPY